MPGCEMSELFLKYSKSKQGMDTKYGWKNFKVQIQKSIDTNQKIQNKFKVQTGWDIFKLSLKGF